MRWKISPNYTNDYLPPDASLNKKIDVFEDRLQGWWLEHGKAIHKAEHSGYVLLIIACVLIETAGAASKVRIEPAKSTADFVSGMELFFPGVNSVVRNVASEFYSEVRCGLVHESLTRQKVIISPRSGRVFNVIPDGKVDRVGTIDIDPYAFFDQVEAKVIGFVKLLRDDKNLVLRKNFEVWFDSRR